MSYFVTFQHSFLQLKCTWLQHYCRRNGIVVLGLSQPFAVQITSSSSANFCRFMNSFSWGKNVSLGARTVHLITCQLKHWLPSKMPSLNYSVTHRIRHLCLYCTTDGWLEDPEQQFFHNEIRALIWFWGQRSRTRQD